MWAALSVVVLAAFATAPPAAITPGTKVRLSAGPTVDVPGVYSSDGGRTVFSRPSRQAEDLLFFTREDGTEEIVLAPKGVLVGIFVDSQGPWIQLLRKGRDDPDLVRRASVARIEVATGRRPGKGAMKGLGIGAGVGLGLGLAAFAASDPGADGAAMATTQGMAVSAVLLGSAVGLGIGALDDVFGKEGWQEVPAESLGAPRSGPPLGVADEKESAEADVLLNEGGWTLVSVGDGPEIAVGIVRTGPLKRAVAGLGSPPAHHDRKGRED